MSLAPSIPISLSPPSRPFITSPTIPGSKSISNRALILAALSRARPTASPITLTGFLFADDTRAMLAAITGLGYPIQLPPTEKDAAITLTPSTAPLLHPATFNCNNSGTTIRFLAAMLALSSTPRPPITLDGIPRMRQRPIAELVTALRAAGAAIDYAAAEGYPPLRIHSYPTTAAATPRTIRFENVKSSQYISALLMAAPAMQSGNAPLAIELLGPITSEPYVAMTLRMMEQFGVRVTIDRTPNRQTLRIPPTGYPGPANSAYQIEPDASNASYFWAAAALVPGSSITVRGLSKNSLQGDVAVTDVLRQMGAQVAHTADSITVSSPPAGQPLRGVDLDMNHIPDMVQTIAVAALFAEGTTHLRNIPNLRVKETDRLAALETELRKFGAAVSTTEGAISITPPPRFPDTPISIATYDDHRMAMSFALATLRLPNIHLEDPDCVRKTYPYFFPDFTVATGAQRPNP